MPRWAARGWHAHVPGDVCQTLKSLEPLLKTSLDMESPAVLDPDGSDFDFAESFKSPLLKCKVPDSMVGRLLNERAFGQLHDEGLRNPNVMEIVAADLAIHFPVATREAVQLESEHLRMHVRQAGHVQSPPTSPQSQSAQARKPQIIYPGKGAGWQEGASDATDSGRCQTACCPLCEGYLGREGN